MGIGRATYTANFTNAHALTHFSEARKGIVLPVFRDAEPGFEEDQTADRLLSKP